MKYTITINQRAIIDSGLNIDFYDAAIIDFIISFSHARSITKINEGDQVFFYFSYSHVINEMPLLSMKRDAVYRRFKKLCDMGFLIAHPRNKEMNKPFYAFTTELLAFISDTYGFKTDAGASTRLISQETPNTSGSKTAGPPVLNPMYNNTINKENEYKGQSPASEPPKLTFKEKSFKKWTQEDFGESIRSAREKRNADKKQPNFKNAMLKAFFAYWSEPDAKGQMKFQKQDTWATGGRLVIWESRDNK